MILPLPLFGPGCPRWDPLCVCVCVCSGRRWCGQNTGLCSSLKVAQQTRSLSTLDPSPARQASPQGFVTGGRDWACLCEDPWGLAHSHSPLEHPQL